MLETFRNAWKIGDLRKRLIYTFVVIVIFRIGCAIPVPYVTASVLSGTFGNGNMLDYLNMLSGGALSQASLFALGVSPYINASIIIQLLTVAIPALENLAKEGEEGRRKINKITQYTGGVLALLMATGFYFILRNGGALTYTDGFVGVFAAAVIIISFVAGALLITWLGQQIDDNGIGNGVSLLIFAGIVARWSSVYSTVANVIARAQGGQPAYYFLLPVIVAVVLGVIYFITVLTNAERRIPVQYAKKVVGRKMYGGQSSHIPLKVNMSGVMPIIFASTLCSIPSTIGGFLNISYEEHPFWYSFFRTFNYTSWVYAVIYLLLIVAFNYFYVSIQYNPIEIANNLRQNNGTIPGIRPGKPTSDFISRTLNRVTLIGAVFLGLVAVMPILFANITGINMGLGGTSLLIVVGVALDTGRSLESFMLMRHHKGFLE